MDSSTIRLKGQIEIGFPEETPRHLRVSIGPGKLKIRPGASEPWVTGTYYDVGGLVKPRVETEHGATHISQKGGTLRLGRGVTPDLDLALGSAQPYALTLDGGANDIRCDLGGLPLTALSGQFGAGRIRIDASSPNPVAMERLDISTGATDLTISNLANFNASEITIDGGAASFHLNFGGQLQRDCHARISTGVASLTVTIPRGIAARIKANTALGSIQIGDGFITRSGGYWTEAALQEGTPVLYLEANASLGSVKVRVE
jgi:hypothetical protein